MVQKNVLAMSGLVVEAAGDVDVLLLDKTGTITMGNRQATEFILVPGIDPKELAEAMQLASLADETPEGRSIVILAENSVWHPWPGNPRDAARRLRTLHFANSDQLSGHQRRPRFARAPPIASALGFAERIPRKLTRPSIASAAMVERRWWWAR